MGIYIFKDMSFSSKQRTSIRVQLKKKQNKLAGSWQCVGGGELEFAVQHWLAALQYENYILHDSTASNRSELSPPRLPPTSDASCKWGYLNLAWLTVVP